MATTLLFEFPPLPRPGSKSFDDCDYDPLEDGFSFPSSWDHSFDLESKYFHSRTCNTRSSATQRIKAKERVKRLPPLFPEIKVEQPKVEPTFQARVSSQVRTAPSAPAPAAPVVIAPTRTVAAPPPVDNNPPRTRHEIELERALRASANDKHESGLTFAQLQDLANRDLTPEDFELLLLLDSCVPKKVVEEEKLGQLNVSVYEEKGDKSECAICMCQFDNGDALKHLPCKHFFHDDCVSTWLSKHSQSCPMCNTKVIMD